MNRPGRWILGMSVVLVLLVPTGAPAAVLKGELDLKPRTVKDVSLSSYGRGSRTIPSPPPTRAAVWVPVTGENAGKVEPGADTSPVTLAQENTHFRPPILPIRVGDYVQFPNRDDEYHNVFSYSEPRRFDLGRYLMDKNAPSIQFKTPGVVRVYCEIHDWMRASILVLETPYYTLSDPEGRFEIRGLPPGSHTVKARSSNGRVASGSVELREGDTVTVTLQLEKSRNDR